MTVQHLLTEWLEDYQKGRIKARTYSRYKGLIEMHIAPYFGKCDISAISRRDIQEFIAQKRDGGNILNGNGLSASSINIMLTILKLAFEYACDREYLSHTPLVRVRRLTGSTAKAEAFTVEEQQALEQEIFASGDRRFSGIFVCLYTGLRIGELLGLTWQDVDLDRGIITVSKTVYREKDKAGTWQLFVDQPKTSSSSRIIPLPGYVTAVLKSVKATAVSPYVVENKKGTRMSIRSYQYLFEQLTIRAGVRKLNFHALRHTFATRAIECGMDIRTVADIMGHKNTSVTLNRYAHCMLEHKMQMMLKLPRIYNQNCNE